MVVKVELVIVAIATYRYGRYKCRIWLFWRM